VNAIDCQKGCSQRQAERRALQLYLGRTKCFREGYDCILVNGIQLLSFFW
jgi:hypothetical protein